MNLELLKKGLNNPQPAVRLNVVRVIGMVEETRLLEPLRQRYQIETVPQVKDALEWAGKRLYKAHQSGYNVIDDLFEHFNLNREIANMQSETEAKMIEQMQQDLDRDVSIRSNKARHQTIGMAGAVTAGAIIAGGGLAASSIMAGALSAGPEAASSNLEPTKDQISSKRTPAPRPSNVDIMIFVKRLREHPDPRNRIAATVELGNLNNPTALPHLAVAFTSDSIHEVRQSAEKFGKILYLSAVYWQMTQDGSLEHEFQRRAETYMQERATNDSPEATTPTSPVNQTDELVQPKEENISVILQRAQAKRAAKKKGRQRR